MPAWTPGLRGKSLAALLLALLLAGVPAALIGWQMLEGVRGHFGAEYARNLTLLNRERILAPVSRELALSQRLADSAVVREFIADESDAQRRRRVFAEAEGFRQAFHDQALFLIGRASGHYYYNEPSRPFSDQPRYRLEADDPQDGWFFAMMAAAEPYNLNVNYDAKLHSTRIWINVLVHDGDRPIGLTGASLDLSRFLARFIEDAGVGVTPMIIDDDGAIQAHPDRTLIALNSAGATAEHARTVFALLNREDATALRTAMADSRERPAEAVLLALPLAGRAQLLALSYIPELHWHVLTAVDLRAAAVFDPDWVAPLLALLTAVLALLLLGFGYLMERWVLRPLRQLQRSAHQVAEGDYELALPAAGADEVGQLGEAFASMTAKVRSHTRELEDRVRERTAELQKAHAEVLAAHKQIDDSIDYASLIQRALLPDRDLQRLLGDRHFVLWRPRDVVGGDFYVFRADGDNFLLGVMDCAGHGVAGALMTMLARSAVDHAVAACGLDDPAAILHQADRSLRGMLADARLARAVATNTDAGLIYVDRRAGQLRFSGAAIGLFVVAAGEVQRLAGSRRPLGDRRGPDYVNLTLPLQPGMSCHLVTDGLLDQAGGELGFGFGSGRLRELLQRHAGTTLAEQGRQLQLALDAYQGTRPQRDDITVLSFALD